jgi:hypothetical protein
MSSHITETTPEILFAEFLDHWGAEWRFEPRWPSDDLERADFRVWLPMLHPARWRLGRVFYVSVGCPVIAEQPIAREFPSYSVAPWTEGNCESLRGYVFYDEHGRVKRRVPMRAKRPA